MVETETGGEEPRDALPSASSPQLLIHLLDALARGVRSHKALEEALGVDPRTVRYYLHAAGWLGLLAGGSDPQLTPEGLALVYAGASRRERFVRALREQPVIAELLEAHGGRPSPADVHALVARRERHLAASTLERKASALRGLLAPLLDAVAVDAGPAEQLDLPLGQGPALVEGVAPARLAGTSFSPDLLRLLLAALLEHGELSLGHVRGLLDEAGASDAPLGGYVEHLLARGDAVRVEDRLVVTPEAVRRPEVASTTAGLVLSDPGWRAHVAAQRGADPPPLGRWRPWDRRLFGHDLDPATLDADLKRVLRDRTLAGHPSAGGPSGFVPAGLGRPFLEVWTEAGLVVALPPTLGQIWEGAPGVNRHLRNARHRGEAVARPSIASRPVAVHGGLLAPGTPPPRVVPDARTLRQRLVASSPYVACTVALLLAHRADPARHELRLHGGEVVVRRLKVRVAPLLPWLDAFGRSRGWVVARRGAEGTLSGARFVSLLEHVGLVVLAGERVVLDDAFFARLRSDDERVELAGPLGALAEAVSAFLDGAAEVR